jgi:hypothetical protein
MAVHGGEFGGGPGTGQDLRQRLPGPVPVGQRRAKRRGGLLFGDRDGTYAELVGLVGEEPDPAARG